MANTIVSTPQENCQETTGNRLLDRLPADLRDYILNQNKENVKNFKRKNTNVPAEGNYTNIPSNTKLKIKNTLVSESIPYAGTLPILPLEKPGKLQKFWPDIYGLLVNMGFPDKEAMVLRRILDLQAFEGRCFASAGYLAKEIFSERSKTGHINEKTVDRAIAAARDQGLIETTRLSRPWDGTNKTDSTNLTDLRKLWALLLELITAGYQDIMDRLKRFAGIVHLKIHGAWVPIEDFVANSQKTRAVIEI